MRRVLSWYAQYFNHKHKRSGHLFENRYKSILCEEDRYLLALVRYIHLNPVRAGIVKIKDYSKKIDEIDQLQALVQKTSTFLAPIIDYFTVRKANLAGNNIVSLTENSYYAFEECGNLSRI